MDDAFSTKTADFALVWRLMLCNGRSHPGACDSLIDPQSPTKSVVSWIGEAMASSSNCHLLLEAAPLDVSLVVSVVLPVPEFKTDWQRSKTNDG